jgi:hypothetical protein
MFKPIDHLKLLHARLEREIKHEHRLLRPDTARISRLKKLKLALRDRIENLLLQQRQLVRT